MLARDTNIPDLSVCVDRSSIRVYAPTQVIFVCGGEVQIPPPDKPDSLRDAFQRVRHTSRLDKYEVRLAEEILPFYPQGMYRDLLAFESDVAQISELILLFSESPGSLAELGAFAIDPEISARMLVVMSGYHYSRGSFIRLGPIQFLQNRHGREAVWVLDDQRLNIPNKGAPADIILEYFQEAMEDAIAARLADGPAREHTTFNPQRNGHLIKLITGFIQHYGALTFDEIDLLLACFDLPRSPNDITNFLLCSKFLGWINEDNRGNNTFYSARNVGDAIQYKFLKDAPVRDKFQWRVDVRSYWEGKEPERFRSIQAALAA